MKKGLVVWFTGLSGSGKSTIAERVKIELEQQGFKVLILDGDFVREHYHVDLGFSDEDILENNRLIALMCKEKRDDNDVVLVPIISPFKESRDLAREHLKENFIEVFIKASIGCVRERDVKGLYLKADKGEITDMIGYSKDKEYEAPLFADLEICTETQTVQESADILKNYILKLK